MRTLEDKFWPKVDKSGGANACWLWIGALQLSGYGYIETPDQTTKRGRRIVRAHRLAYELCIGKIPHGAFVCHHCDVPRCCNPHHLFLGDNKANMADMKSKRRGRAACGVTNSRAKLTISDVTEILASSEPSIVLARRYNIGSWTIWRIRSGRGWLWPQGRETIRLSAKPRMSNASTDAAMADIRKCAAEQTGSAP